MIGEVLGFRYELLEAIGEGGMAIVYKARDKKLNRYVAVKVLKKEFSDNEEIAQKFKSEATAIANLSHGNIVNVLDVGHEEDKNIEYFVMEYVSGKTLKELISYNGKLSYSTAMNIAMQIAKALDAAHYGNIIHRDVKPQNILITENGEVKVTDFGIAKSSTSATITNTTTIMGTAHYLSPEQAKGTFIDIRTDVYSLGVVMYEMVTGRLPYDGESPVTIALKHIQQELIPPKQINSSIPESVNSLIVKTMSKEPVDRYQNCKELILDIQKIKDNPDIILNVQQEKVDDKTIIMGAITPKNNNITSNAKTSEKSTRSKYIEEMYEEDDDDEYEDGRSTKSIVLMVIGGIIAAALLIGGSFFIGTKIFSGESTPELKTAIMPDLLDKDYSNAKKELDSLGIDYDLEIVEKNSDKDINTVLETNPVSGVDIQDGESITITVSGGKEKVEVPDLRDYEINYIKTYLEDKGLKYEITEVFSENIKAGYIVSQNPERNVEVDKGTIVKLEVSKGAEVKFVTVPNLKGYTVEEATKMLEDLKLVIDAREKATDRESEEGIIIEQPAVNTKVEEGTPVVVFFGEYSAPKIDMTIYLTEGMKLSDAINTLNLYEIKYSIVGGAPQTDVLDKYKIVSFSKEIEEGGTVEINVEKIQETIEPPVEQEPETEQGTEPQE